MKMKTNDIIECFNKCLDLLREKNNSKCKGHFVIYSSWERKMGPIKVAETHIDYVVGTTIEYITTHISENIASGQEEMLIAKSEEKALTLFISKWTEEIDKFVNNTFEQHDIQ